MKTATFGEYQLSRLMLGTAQFGQPYGVANVAGQPSFEEVCAILESACAGGVNCLDTAPYYGQSEVVLGQALRATGLREKMHVVSKAMRTVNETLSAAALEKVVEAEVVESLRRLQLEVLPLCLMHWEGNFPHFEALLRLKEKGLIRHVGCSITDVSKARAICRSGLVEAMQIPLNLLDRRLTEARDGEANFLEEAAQRGVTIFARSAYLQGLLAMEPKRVPENLRAIAPLLYALRDLAGAGGMQIEELALRYVLSLRGANCVVVGVESNAQLQSNLRIFERGALDSAVLEQISALVPPLPEKILNPHLWNK